MKSVTPANAGVRRIQFSLDSGWRRNDESPLFRHFAKRLGVCLLIATLLPGCGDMSYKATNCSAGSYGHCDRDDVPLGGLHGDKRYQIRNNLLYLSSDGAVAKKPASKEEVLDFAINNPEFVAMYDPIADIATVHRRVFSYEGRTGEILLGTALIVVGTAAILASARRNQNCYDRHISRYRDHRDRTRKNIWENDAKGVGSKAWHADIDSSHRAAMDELHKAYRCLY